MHTLPDRPDSDQSLAVPPGVELDAIDSLIGTIIAGLPVQTVWLVSDGVINTAQDHRHAFVYWADYTGRVPLVADTLAPLNGYRFAFVGLRVPDSSQLSGDDDRLSLHLPQGWLHIKFWRQRLWPGTANVCADLLTLPNAPEHGSIGGLELPHTQRERDAAWRGLAQLREHIQARGEPRGPSRTPREVARESLLDACERSGYLPEQISLDVLQRYLFLQSKRGVSHRLKAAGWTLRALQAAYDAQQARADD